MMLPRKQVETVEHAIERRLVQTMVADGVRPLEPVRPVRKASAARTGLFLVKPVSAEAKLDKVGLIQKLKAVRMEEAQAKERVRPGGKGPCRVIAMPDYQKQAEQERWMGLMAGVGPILWLCHATLVWLKVV